MRIAIAAVLAVGFAAPALADTVEATASARVAASPDRVLAVLADFESWDRVFACVETLAAERHDGERARVRQRVHRAGLTLGYTLAATVDRETRRVELVLDPSEPTDMEVLVTSWHVVPHPDGGAEITLRVVTRTRFPVPAFVERHVTRSTARDSVAELVRAIERSETAHVAQSRI